MYIFTSRCPRKCTSMLNMALFLTDRNWKKLKCPSIRAQMNRNILGNYIQLAYKLKLKLKTW